MSWKYLCSKPYQIRHLIAAHYLQDCENVIEIGGYKTPITQFLTHKFHKAVSIDPLIEPLQKKNTLHAQEDFRYFDFKPYLTKPYGLVMLGMDLPFDFKLFPLAASAKRLIIEIPDNYKPSQLQFELLEKNISWRVDLQLHLDFSGNDIGTMEGSFPIMPHRKLYVLTPKK